MASLEELLSRTMLFTAVADNGGNPYRDCRVGATDPIVFSPPTVSGGVAAEDRAVWHWKHDPSAPTRITDLDALVRKSAAMPEMTMRVCERIEATEVTVTVEQGGDPTVLPLSTDFIVAKFKSSSGHVKPNDRGWWQLESKTDWSYLVVFGYELPPFSGAKPKPLKKERIEALGIRFFPKPEVPAEDPDGNPGAQILRDAASPPAEALTGQQAFAYVAPTWVIVAFGLTTCKERADFEPGELLGAGRVYPHVMVACNRSLASTSATIDVVRPSKATTCQEEMEPDMGALLFTDTNAARGATPLPAPVPIWSNIFDYYDLQPKVGVEFTMVDPTRAVSRRVVGAIQRESWARGLPGVTAAIYQSESPFTKAPRQGDFDNLHLAPRMTFLSKKNNLEIPHIEMAPFCIHDCFHTHFRWGDPALTDPPKSNQGFDGRRPYATINAPLVPSNQRVTVRLTSASSFTYRAIASAPIRAGTWTVFNHHGSSYALAIASDVKFFAAQDLVQETIMNFAEPWTHARFEPIPPHMEHEIVDVHPKASVAAFYKRLQFTASAPFLHARRPLRFGLLRHADEHGAAATPAEERLFMQRLQRYENARRAERRSAVTVSRRPWCPP